MGDDHGREWRDMRATDVHQDSAAVDPEPVGKRGPSVAGKLATVFVLLYAAIAGLSVTVYLDAEREVAAARSGVQVASSLSAASKVLERLENERIESLAAITSGRDNGASALPDARKSTDQAIAALKASASPWQVMSSRLEELPRLRTRVDGRDVTADQVRAGYTNVIQAGLDEAAATPSESSPAGFAHLLAAREQVALLQADTALALLAPRTPGIGESIASDVVLTTTAFRRLQVTASSASSTPVELISGSVAYTDALRIAGEVSRQAQGVALPAFADWRTLSDTVLKQLDAITAATGDEVRGLAEQTVSQAEENRIRTAVLLGGLLLAAVVPFIVIRRIARRARALRDVTQSIVDDGLDQADLDHPPARLTMAARVDDEIGQVARLVQQLRLEAIHLAYDQQVIRRGNVNVLANLSRRCQSLVGRQLSIIERWENETSDSADLENLFKLDHLATRMRRINDNLLLLSGGDTRQVHQKPTSLSDVLQAAISEIEQYKRVSVRRHPTVKIKGGLAADLRRMLAELLENAAAFSSPDTRVLVTCRMLEDRSLSISVLDSGIGMTDEVAAGANARLSAVGSIDLVGAQRLGLFVVGRLAGKHGLPITLHAGTDITGVRAMITVPPTQLLDIESVPDEHDVVLAEESAPLSHRSEDVEPRPQTRPVRDIGLTSRPRRARTAPRSGDGLTTSPFFQRSPRANAAENHDLPESTEQVVSWTPESDPEFEPGWFKSGRRGQNGSSGTGAAKSWSSVADSDWKIVDTVFNLEPEEYDENGLPQRRQGARLISGGIGDAGDAMFPRGRTVTPEETRDRLRGFRQGLARQSESFQAPEPRRPVPEPSSEWTMLSDNGWERAQQVSQKPATTFTDDGLPQRVNGQNLLPGSARTTLPSTPSAPRDPERIRNRAGSFRNGVLRARSQD
ncbi:nitrate- and nitrite sensing domain-containing protein [Lentzea sp. NPDC051213]|uniref:sensor histidine kinase n=1 Tax=Lentzea sp. NPDC051213 TaxID=3364126 RepID=UPI00378E8B92